jgi:hypothetical protein
LQVLFLVSFTAEEGISLPKPLVFAGKGCLGNGTNFTLLHEDRA